MRLAKSAGLACASLVAITCGFATSAFAEAAAPAAAPPTDGVQEITVTAQRREQRLQDVGVSVSALGAADLRKMGISDSKDIVKAIPGVLMDSTAGGGVNANLAVRGISQSDFSSIQESPNSMYIDEVYLASPNAAAFTLYDLSRVEVLRGPQGTLFGRASSGGLANFITTAPSKEWNGYAELGYSSFNDSYGEAAVGGPLSDRIRFRLAGRVERSDGWFQNGLPGGSATFEKNFNGIRGQIEADVSERLTARLSVSYDSNPTHSEGMYRTVPAYLVNGHPQLLPADVDAYGTGAGNDFAGYRNPYSQFNKADFNNVGFLSNSRFAPTLHLLYDLGEAKITSITNYTRFKFSYNEDCDGGPTNYCNFPFGQDLKQISQELRINGKHNALTYTGGFYFLNTTQNSPINFVFPSLSGTAYAFNAHNAIYQHVRSYAAFTQLEYEFTPKLKLTGGLRFTDENKSIDSKLYYNELGSAYGGAGVYATPLLAYDFSEASVGGLANHTEGLWSGKVQLDYKASRDALFYASFSRGVKSAGFNSNVSGGLSIAATPFKSEYLYAYEAGEKLQLFGRKLRINGGVFYYDYHRFQGFAFTGLQGVVGNYDGNFKGGELEITAAPIHNLDLNISTAYLDTKLKNVPTQYSGVIDEQSIMAPHWTVNGSVNKIVDTGFGSIAFNWNGNYVSSRYASIENDAATFVPGSFVHNARVTVTLKDANVELAFFVNNISNKARMNFSYDLTASTGSWLQSYAPPRWIGGSIRKSF